MNHTEIPPEESIIAAGRELIESTDSWKAGKTYFTKVKTLHSSAGPSLVGAWHCRLSEHPPNEVTFEQLWDKMANNKAVNEREYVNSGPHGLVLITTLTPSASSLP